jgi:hypothetical protein
MWTHVQRAIWRVLWIQAIVRGPGLARRLAAAGVQATLHAWPWDAERRQALGRRDHSNPICITYSLIWWYFRLNLSKESKGRTGDWKRRRDAAAD